MFNTTVAPGGDLVLSGRLTADHVHGFEQTLAGVTGSCRVDLKDAAMISSAGLGALLACQKRLEDTGGELILYRPSRRIREVFRLVGFSHIFRIEDEAVDAS